MSDPINLLHTIEEAFSTRKKPSTVVNPDHSNDDDYEDALEFKDKTWKELTCEDLQRYYVAISFWLPEAYCYFLPGIYSAIIRENKPDLIVVGSIIGCLDRSNTPGTWDDFFAERWLQLTVKEYEATLEWILWLSDCYEAERVRACIGPDLRYESQLTRAFDTLNLLIARQGAVPLAGRFPRK
jgi:hypothetical protein